MFFFAAWMKFGLILVAFWEAILRGFGDVLGVSGAPFWRPWGGQRSDFGGPGLTLGSILGAFW